MKWPAAGRHEQRSHHQDTKDTKDTKKGERAKQFSCGDFFALFAPLR
jgi:hypothetical protein